MELASLKVAPADVNEPIVPLKPPVDPASLEHLRLRTGPFWQKIPAYADITEERFLDHTWQSKNSITRVDKLFDTLKGIVSEEFVKDAEIGFQRAPMSVRGWSRRWPGSSAQTCLRK